MCRLRHRELSSLELRELDYKVADGQDRKVERTLEASHPVLELELVLNISVVTPFMLAEQDLSSTSDSRALLRAGPLRQVRGDAAGPAGRLASVRPLTCLSCTPLLPAHRPLLGENFRNSAALREHSRVLEVR